MRIAIVNDLALAREVLRRLVLSAAEHSVAWTAENGAEAVRFAAQDRPDVILMDLVMPVMDGAEATRRIMAQSPCPILLVTATVSGNFALVYKAMGYGGLDAVNTPTLGPGGRLEGGEAILARLAKVDQTRALSTGPLPTSGPERGASPPVGPTRPPLVILGASTGGPEAVAQILAGLPVSLPAAVVVIQHIGAGFAPGLAEWLQVRSPLPVRLAVEGQAPAATQVVVAGTDDHLVLRPTGRFAYTADPAENPYRPSVDVFCATAEGWAGLGLAVLLTGMGSDGARGLARLRRAGWTTIAQDQATSIVFGMPRAAVELGAASQVLPLSAIAPAIRRHLNASGPSPVLTGT
jgi:two-component system response regulator WspF